jgi:hypothetical protein
VGQYTAVQSAVKHFFNRLKNCGVEAGGVHGSSVR